MKEPDTVYLIRDLATGEIYSACTSLRAARAALRRWLTAPEPMSSASLRIVTYDQRKS